MSRPLRIEYPGAWYHILNRGRRREKIFFHDVDYKKFLSLLADVTRLYSAEIHAYSLMPNHYHLLICTPQGNLSRIMRHVNGVFTQCSNIAYKREGSLFKGRYKSILIDDEEYLLELVRYIHRNAYKARLVKKIGEHKWSSHRAYMHPREKPECLKVKTVLKRFSRYEKDARRRLDQFVKRETDADVERILDGTKWPAVLGGETFKEMIRHYALGDEIVEREVPQVKGFKLELDIDELMLLVEESCGFKEGELQIKKRQSTQNAKKAFVYIGRRYAQFSQVEIGDALGGTTGGVLTRMYSRAEDEISKREGCVREFNRILKTLKQESKT